MGRNLAERAEQARGTDVAQAPPLTLEQQIQRMEVEYQRAMPKGAEATQLVRDALTCLRTIPKLAQCDSASVLGALMTCAQLGLRPGVLGQAWPLPFWDYKAGPENPRTGKPMGGYRAQLIIGYQGLVELAHRSGRVSSLIARTVCSGDVFEVDYGLSDNLVHKPNLNGARGEPIAYYAIVKFTNGGHAFYVMSHSEMCTYRDRFASTKSKEDGRVFGPWKENFEGMALKTVVRQLAKWMPKSAELAQAIAADEGIRIDLNPEAGPESSTVYVDALQGEVVDDSSEEPTDVDEHGWPKTAKPDEGGDQ
jgi:recombination protein RecT